VSLFSSIKIKKAFAIQFFVVVSIGLGVGITVAALSLAAAFGVASLPFRNHEVLTITESIRGKNIEGVSILDLDDLAKNDPVFAQVAAYTTSVSGVQAWFLAGSSPRKISPAFVSSNYFEVLGVNPTVGSLFNNSEKPEVMLSSRLWSEHFGSAPEIVGKSIYLNGHYYDIAGVLPSEFDLPIGTDIWVKERLFDPNYTPYRANYAFVGLAVLKNGKTLAEARSSAGPLSHQLQTSYPATNKFTSFVISPLVEELQKRLYSVVRIFYLLGSSLLIIVWVNCFTLILARQIHRRNEYAIRLSLGNPFLRLFGSVTREVVGSAVLGLGAGALVAMALLAKLEIVAGILLPRYVHPHINWAVFGVCAALTIAVATAIAIYSAWLTWHTNPSELLRGGSQNITLGRKPVNSLRLLLATDVGITTVIVFCSLVFVQQLVSMQNWRFGIEYKKVQTMEFVLPTDGNYNGPELAARMSQLLTQLHGLPGVENAAIASEDPFNNHYNFELTASNHVDKPLVSVKGVTPDYFQTLSVPVVQGRTFTPEEMVHFMPVCLIDHRLASLLWPNKNPVGQTFILTGMKLQVVGMVGDVNFFGRNNYHIYLPIQDMWVTQLRILYSRIYVRAHDELQASLIQQTSLQAIPNILIGPPASMKSELDGYLVVPALGAQLAGPIAILAVLLSGLGAFSIVTYVSFLKNRDIATRLTLGATRGSIALDFGKFVALPALFGIVAGLGLTVLLAPFVSQALRKPMAFEPAALAISVGVMVLLMFVATLAPIRRAAKVDPIVLLRGL